MWEKERDNSKREGEESFRENIDYFYYKLKGQMVFPVVMKRPDGFDEPA